MKFLSTAALAAAAGVAHAATHDAPIRQVIHALRENAAHATERRGLQADGVVDLLVPCFEAIGIPEEAYECFLVDFDTEVNDSDSGGEGEESEALSTLFSNPGNATAETCQEAFQPRTAQCAVFFARMENAPDVFKKIINTNFTSPPAECKSLFEVVIGDEGSSDGSNEVSIPNVEYSISQVTAVGDICEALVPGVTTSKLGQVSEPTEAPTNAPTVSSGTGDDDDDDSTAQPTNAPIPSPGDDDDDDSTAQPTNAPTPSSGDDDDDVTAAPTTAPTTASSASTGQVAVAAGVLAALLVR